jgi:1-acyl-sn-glycerol-3-phosphate acyltransferase
MSLSDRVTWHVMRFGAWALAAGRVKVAVTGLEHIPREGPVLLVVRHYHHLFDGVVLLLSMPRRIHILVTLDWATNRYARRLMTLATKMARWPVVLRSDALRAGVNHAGEFFSATDIRRYQRSAFSDSVTLLAEGGILVVFPEGYPNIDPHYTPKMQPEEFLPFRSGFASIAAAAEKRLGIKIPIVPGGFRYRKNSRWTAQLNIGEAFYLENFASRQLLVHYTERRVAELSGRS